MFNYDIIDYVEGDAKEVKRILHRADHLEGLHQSYDTKRFDTLLSLATTDPEMALDLIADLQYYGGRCLDELVESNQLLSDLSNKVLELYNSIESRLTDEEKEEFMNQATLAKLKNR